MMTEKITTTLYLYTINGNYATDYRSIPSAVEQGHELWVDSSLRQDEIIGGTCKEIKEDTLELIYHIYDVPDESVFNHPSVIWWDKQLIENEITLTKLPTKKGRNVSWKSRNRGGGVRHKNFDKAATKPYKPYTEMPKKEKSINKIVLEPPMGIMGIFKKENGND